MNKIIGVIIETKSTKTMDKIYYYKTDEDLKRGDNINIKTPRGGTPSATVVIQDSKKAFNREIKPLEKAK